MMFNDRLDAAQALISLLARYATEDVIVMAVPRGAVPMGEAIADHFGWPLSVVLVKKIGHPHNKEYAIGAASLDSVLIDPGHGDVAMELIDAEVGRVREILRDRQSRFFGGRTIPSVKGKTVVIVDDGIATGATIKASIALLRTQAPAKIVVAVPVASSSAVEELEPLVDDLIVLESSPLFGSVGQFYDDFPEVTDDDVERILTQRASRFS